MRGTPTEEAPIQILSIFTDGETWVVRAILAEAACQADIHVDDPAMIRCAAKHPIQAVKMAFDKAKALSRAICEPVDHPIFNRINDPL